MKSNYLKLLPACLLLIFSSCKKEAGEGRQSFIKGKVYADYYDKNFYAHTDSKYAVDVDVYIIYGEDISHGDHQKTSFDGSYEFKYLRKGKYKIYAFSKDTTGLYINQAKKYAPEKEVIESVEITKNKQTIEVPNLEIIIQ